MARRFARGFARKLSTRILAYESIKFLLLRIVFANHLCLTIPVQVIDVLRGFYREAGFGFSGDMAQRF